FAAVSDVYTGNALTTLTGVACNLGNPLQFDATKGITYYIQVGNNAGLVNPATFLLQLLRASDTTPPTLVLPSDIVVDASSPAGAVVSYTATATDDGGLNPTVACAPLSGSVFHIG